MVTGWAIGRLSLKSSEFLQVMLHESVVAEFANIPSCGQPSTSGPNRAPSGLMKPARRAEFSV